MSARVGSLPSIPLLLLASLLAAPASRAEPPPFEPLGFFESEGLRIAYESHGDPASDRPPVVLVHGYGVGPWVFAGLIDALAADRHVLVLHVRGHGDSEKPHRQELYGYAAMAQDVLSLLDHFAIPRADYLGYSMGAFMGAHLLGHHPERFRAVVLAGIGDETEETLADAPGIAAALRAEDPSTIEDPDDAFWRFIVDADVRNDREALALAALEMWPDGFPRELGGPGLASADRPVLILNGAEDVPYVDTDDDLAAAIPGARLTEIPGADHFGAVFDPRFQEAVLDFLGCRYADRAQLWLGEAGPGAPLLFLHLDRLRLPAGALGDPTTAPITVRLADDAGWQHVLSLAAGADRWRAFGGGLRFRDASAGPGGLGHAWLRPSPSERADTAQLTFIGLGEPPGPPLAASVTSPLRVEVIHPAGLCVRVALPRVQHRNGPWKGLRAIHP